MTKRNIKLGRKLHKNYNQEYYLKRKHEKLNFLNKFSDDKLIMFSIKRAEDLKKQKSKKLITTTIYDELFGNLVRDLGTNYSIRK